jgi:hypothetical protein
LAKHTVGSAIQGSIEEPVMPGKFGERGRGSGVLNRKAKKGAEQQYQEVEMKHAGEDQLGAESA